MKALLYVIHKAYIPVCVGAIHVGKFDRGTGMAAVEDDEQGTAGRQFGDETAMQSVAV